MQDQQAAFEAQTASYTEAGTRVAAAHKAIEAVTMGLTQSVNGENKASKAAPVPRAHYATRCLDDAWLCVDGEM